MGGVQTLVFGRVLKQASKWPPGGAEPDPSSARSTSFENSFALKAARKQKNFSTENAAFSSWQDGDTWLGHRDEFPDYLTRGESFGEFKAHLMDLFRDPPVLF